MKGDDFTRHCESCEKNVYNLSLLTRDEANDLIREKEGKLCISLYRRFDGTVLTADCPTGLRAIRRQYLKTRAKVMAFAAMIWGFIIGTSSCTNPFEPRFIGVAVMPPNFHADINGKHEDTYAYAINDTSLNEIMVSTYDSTMWIFIDSSERAPGTYKNHHGIFPAGGYHDHSKLDSNIWYDGELKIIDINSYHASGTFWFNARDSSSTDTVKITNGSFETGISFGKIPK